jgi:hypothetical protein
MVHPVMSAIGEDEFMHPLFALLFGLVVSLQCPSELPCYLLTSEPVHTPDQAWKTILIYARRWQIEFRSALINANWALKVGGCSPGSSAANCFGCVLL